MALCPHGNYIKNIEDTTSCGLCNAENYRNRKFKTNETKFLKKQEAKDVLIKEKKEAKRRIPNYEKPTHILKKLAQDKFNAFIRKRDKKELCICCKSAKVEQAGHFYSAGHYNHLRFNEDNVHGCCIKCNYFLSGNLGEYRKNLEIKIGKKRLEHLDFLKDSKTSSKNNRFEYLEIIEKYK